MSLSNEIEVLIRLGLTKNQAKIYFSLVQSGPATVKQISKNAKVPRENVYRTIPSLFKRGLIQKELSTPIMLDALPIKNAFSLLLASKTYELSKIQNEIAGILYRFEMKTSKKRRQEEAEILLIPGGERHIVKAISELEKTRKSVSMIISLKRFTQFLYKYSGVVEKALERNINYRVITNVPDNETKIPEAIRILEEMPSFEMKCVTSSSIVNFAVYDDERVLIGYTATDDLGKAPVVWSTNSCLVELASNYFDMLWCSLSEVNSKKSIGKQPEAVPRNQF